MTWSRLVQFPRKQVPRWFAKWQRTCSAVRPSGGKTERRQRVTYDSVKRFRKRHHGGGRHHRAPLVRQALFEWFVSMRFNVDWDALNKRFHSRGNVRKAIGRFTRGLVRTKATQLIADYVSASLLNGQRPKITEPTPRWLASFSDDYGLSFRYPNRMYKVSK